MIVFCGCFFVLTAAPLMLHLVKSMWSFLFHSSVPRLLLEIFLQTCSLSAFHFSAGELINLMQFGFLVSKPCTATWSSEEIYFGNTAVAMNDKPCKWKFWSYTLFKRILEFTFCWSCCCSCLSSPEFPSPHPHPNLLFRIINQLLTE